MAEFNVDRQWDAIQANEGPFGFIFSREGLRERSHPFMPQE
jgi:hypothetical protein